MSSGLKLENNDLDINDPLPSSDVVSRTKEYNEIKDFIEKNINNQTSQHMIIHGPPGTGKTLVVKKVLLSIKCSNCFILFFNSMEFRKPALLLSAIFRKLSKLKIIRPKLKNKSLKALKSELSKRNKKTSIVLAIDEIEFLVNDRSKGSKILSALFDISSAESPEKIIFIGISNFTCEDICKNSIDRDLSLIPNLVFSPYQQNSLIGILNQRYLFERGRKVNNAKGINFIAEKIASTSGDARRALSIMRKIMENKNNKITVRSAVEVFEQIEKSEEVKRIEIEHLLSSLPSRQKILLLASFCYTLKTQLKDDNKRNKTEDFVKFYSGFCQMFSLPRIPFGAIREILDLLQACGLLKVTRKKKIKVVLSSKKELIRTYFLKDEFFGKIVNKYSC